MAYTHIVIGPPDFEGSQLQSRKGWEQMKLVGEVRTAQALTLVFESENPVATPVSMSAGRLSLTMDLLDAAPEIWHLYANCDGRPRQRSSNL